MSADRILFVIRTLNRTAAEARVRTLGAYYEPCGVVRISRNWHESLGLLVGEVVLGSITARTGTTSLPVATDGTPDDLLTFGERLPENLASVAALLDATDADLRALDGGQGAFACDGRRARLIEGGGAPRVWFHSGQAWASHAAAAAILGGSPIALDERALIVHMALGAPLGSDSLLRGVSSLPAATVVEFGRDAVPVRSFWHRADRWAMVAKHEASEMAERALADTIRRRIGTEPSPWLALTAGRDSPVVLSVSRQLGIEMPCFTWGEASWPDVTGAAAVASAFGVPHRHMPLREVADWRQAQQIGIADALWADGTAGLGGYASPELPAEMTAMVTGAGAEIGRAYYYYWVSRSYPRPKPARLLATLGAPGRVPASHREIVSVPLLAWLDDAAELGHSGWTALDVFYTEERMGRWGRARCTRGTPPIITPFTAPEVARALVSLPANDRLTAAWHRRIVGDIVTLPAQDHQRRGVPAAARRLVASRRSRREREPTERWFAADVWQRLPTLLDWIADDVLSSPALESALGSDWLNDLRVGLRAGQAHATDQALLAASAAIQTARLADLAGGLTPHAHRQDGV